ncbi:MAG: glycosyltransferase family 2 protein [Candidatus Omnitrophota bacterium]
MMKVSVIIPVYNEKDSIRDILKRVASVPINKEIIVVDDGSTDGTRELLEKADIHGLKVLKNNANRGKGYSIRRALKHVTGDVVLVQDADLEYSPNDYPSLLAPIISGEAEVVYGSRCLEHGLKGVPLSLFRIGRRLLTSLTNLLYGTKITDEPCGYKVFKTETIKSIPLVCERFEFCPEVTAKLLRRGHKIHEVSISYNPRTIAEGKKITYRDGMEAIITLLRYRFWK